jgi:CheY-like chemotaxis protein
MNTEQLRVAIVDDNKDIVATMAKLLTMAGFRVVAQVTDPKMAFDYIADERPDVVLLDIRMPYLDGYTLANRIRQNLVPSPRLVAVTGFGKQEDKVQAADAGFDAHFVKPVEWPKLEALLLSYANNAQAT